MGQERAKKVLSVAVYNHYQRIRSVFDGVEARDELYNVSPDDAPSGVSGAQLRPYKADYSRQHLPPIEPLFEKSNVLVIGPTGSGKTLLAKTLAKVLDVPFSVSDATSFTQAGYVGDDVEMAVHRLLQAADWDPQRASAGIVYIDEIDKIARRQSGSGVDGSRDVGGEGVQQALLRMMEGSVVTVQNKGSTAAEAPPMGGQGRSRNGQRNPAFSTMPRPESFDIDTSNVLFILSGAFVGLETIIKQRTAKGSIGFAASLPNFEDNRRTGLPFFTSNKAPQANTIELVETEDLVKYGFIPEFISRMPSITTLAPLSVKDLRCILTEVKGSLVSQYMSLFAASGVELRFTSGALDEICRKAFERGGGARGLRGIIETMLLDAMYETPGSSIGHVLVTEAAARGDSPMMYWRKGDSMSFDVAWEDAEGAYEDKSNR